MTKQEAIKFIQQLYPVGGHCWLDEQRIEAIGMAIKALQEESVSDTQSPVIFYGLTGSVGSPKEEPVSEQNLSNIQRTVKDYKEPVNEELGDYINKLSKQFPEVSFAKLSRIAVRVAKWKKQQIMKDAVEGEIVKDIANNLYIGKAKVNKNNFKFGDKVKLLVLKEE